ncbi:hypothetical protein K490DRAFT_65005 [Saccharata proteae CBS 121410]|uniref:Ubiquitin-conjugating enzyme E2-binding protein n=1 Tax=Saccharata proteae CBS 121410 TaxID=1314787 RepID=A0A9P4HYQ9_9PEZI|nr:hypothetical protein K490DRAFT_65005 [Saccharata proteae CBS 121410]
MSSILHLYAELLLNIKTVNLFASLKTEHTSETKAELSADGEFISLTHEGETASIRLPTQIEGGGSAALTLPPRPSKDLTLRLQLQEKSAGLLKFSERTENVVPWSATSLQSSTEISCQSCKQTLVWAASPDSHEGIKEWMDLPNENWAEMMDFWHCHKPDEHHLPAHKHGAGHSKGYAASNRLTARPRVGYVDLAYILVTQKDCRNVELIPASDADNQPQQLRCADCKTTIGAVDERAEGWRLWKWSVAISSNGTPPVQYSTPKWISAQLLALIENQGVRKFVIDSQPPTSEEALNIWVFTPDLSFSSSVQSSARQDPTRAMKIFWKQIPRQQISGATSQSLDKQSLSVEELNLPQNAFEALAVALKESAELLPASARRFSDWNVGLLERFQERDIQDAVAKE